VKAKTHIAIAGAVARALRLDKALADALKDGVTAPDRHPERFLNFRVKHHSPNFPVIMSRLWRARCLWLKGRRVKAAYELGWALHYVQDRCVGRMFWEDAAAHSAVEAEVARFKVPEDLAKEASEAGTCSLGFVEWTVSSLEAKRGYEALEEAVVASKLVSKAVLGPVEPPAELVQAFRKCVRRHYARLLLELGFLAFGFALILLNPLYTLPFFTVAFTAYLTDGRYRRLKREMEWFKTY